MSRWLAYGVGLTATVAALSPMLSWETPRRDSYPLSTYPMFSVKRDRARVYQLAGVRGETRTPLPPSLVVRGTEVMQAAVTIRRSAEAGPEPTQRLCEQVAERARETPAWASLDAIELGVLEFDPVAYFSVDRKPVSREVLTRCAVKDSRR